MLKFDWLMTNGISARDYNKNVKQWELKGWKLIRLVPAKEVHPYAMDTDWCYVFSKYEEVADGDTSETYCNY